MLTFVLDQGVKRSIEISRMLRESQASETNENAADLNPADNDEEPDDSENETDEQNNTENVTGENVRNLDP